MRIYLVRHGETPNNAANMYQTADVPLSDQGLDQAKNLAKRFSDLPVDLILCSPFDRAKKTAEFIKEVTKKEIVFDDTLKEVKRPTEFLGKRLDDPEIMEHKKKILEMGNDESWHLSDEENFYDLKKRAEKFIEHIEGHDEENIVVVTHSVLMKMIFAVMFFKNEINAQIFDDIYHFFVTSNTGITVCEKLENSKWKLITWNDHAHLG